MSPLTLMLIVFDVSPAAKLIDPLGRIRGYYNGTDEAEVNGLIHDIDKLKIEFKL